MNPQTPARKPRSDCLLKNLSAQKQEAIADYGLTHSVTATRDWIVEQYKLRPGRTAVGEFLSWAKTIDQRCQNRGAVRALAAPLESDEPDLTAEELERLAKKHFAETVIEKSDLLAWHRAQRIAIRQEEVRLLGEELKLKRQMFECKTAEWAVMTFTNPKLKSIAQNTKKTYAERIGEARSLMFGEEQSPESEVQSQSNAECGVQNAESVGKMEKEKGGKGEEANIQQPTSNIQHPVEGEKGGVGANIQHPTSNIEHPVNGAEAPTSNDQHPENGAHSSIPQSAICTPHSNSLQPSTPLPQLSPAPGSMSPTDALNFAENLRTKVKQICLATINHWDVAALTACLSGQPAKWYSTRIGDHEIMPPPPVDPRLDPESPWFNAWKEYVKGELL